jgi:hypothetical protein
LLPEYPREIRKHPEFTVEITLAQNGKTLTFPVTLFFEGEIQVIE